MHDLVGKMLIAFLEATEAFGHREAGRLAAITKVARSDFLRVTIWKQACTQYQGHSKYGLQSWHSLDR